MAIEADLAFRGFDLGHLFRTKQWRKLLNLIDHLPRHSFFAEALLLDEELAEASIESEVAPVQRHSEWSADHEVLVAMFEQLQQLVHILLKVNGGKPGQFRPWPRPPSMADEARHHRLRMRHESLVRRVLPDRKPGFFR
jgi:hypothetical protein